MRQRRACKSPFGTSPFYSSRIRPSLLRLSPQHKTHLHFLLYCGYAHFSFTLHFGAPDVAYLSWRFQAVLTTFTDARAYNFVSSSQRRLCSFPLCMAPLTHSYSFESTCTDLRSTIQPKSDITIVFSFLKLRFKCTCFFNIYTSPKSNNQGTSIDT